MKKKNLFLPVLLTGFATVISMAAAYSQRKDVSPNEDRYQSYLTFNTLVSGMYVRPHWFADGNRFWFAGGTADSTVIYEVDPGHNTKKNSSIKRVCVQHSVSCWHTNLLIKASPLLNSILLMEPIPLNSK